MIINLYFNLELDDNATFYIQCLRSESITADDYDLYWRKCAKLRFKQIKEAQDSNEIFRLWPEYIKASISQLVSFFCPINKIVLIFIIFPD